MNTNNNPPAPEKTLTEIQLSLARVAFRLAQTTEIIAGRIASSNNKLLPEPDSYAAVQDLNRISKEMMDVAGDLLGIADENE